MEQQARKRTINGRGLNSSNFGYDPDRHASDMKHLIHGRSGGSEGPWVVHPFNFREHGLMRIERMSERSDHIEK